MLCNTLFYRDLTLNRRRGCGIFGTPQFKYLVINYILNLCGIKLYLEYPHGNFLQSGRILISNLKVQVTALSLCDLVIEMLVTKKVFIDGVAMKIAISDT